MNESFSIQRFWNLFKWQMGKIQPLVFIFLSIGLFIYSYFNTMIHYTNLNSNSDKYTLFVFVIAISTNFFKQMIRNDTASGFLMLPSSTSEKFIFLLTSVVILPIVLFMTLIKGGDLLARMLYEVPASYSYMNFHAYLTLLLVASITFFVHCLPRKSWKIGVSSLFVVFIIFLSIIQFKRKHDILDVISDFLSAMNQPLFLVIISSVVIILAYVFFKRNEISNFKVYE